MWQFQRMFAFKGLLYSGREMTEHRKRTPDPQQQRHQYIESWRCERTRTQKDRKVYRGHLITNVALVKGRSHPKVTLKGGPGVWTLWRHFFPPFLWLLSELPTFWIQPETTAQRSLMMWSMSLTSNSWWPRSEGKGRYLDRNTEVLHEKQSNSEWLKTKCQRALTQWK